MATLTNTKIKDTYDGLLKTTDNDVIGASEKIITDGLGNASVLSIGTGSASFSGNVDVNSNSLQLTGDTNPTILVTDTTNSVSVGLKALDGSTKIDSSHTFNIEIGNDIIQSVSSSEVRVEADFLVTGTLTSTEDATINGLTIGKGNGSLSTNTAIGINALDSVTSGVDNTAVGNSAMQNVTQGVDNAAYGTGAMVSTTTGSYNTSIGSASLPANTTGGSNTAVGLQVMQSNTTGGANTVVGMSALNDNTEGNRNTTLGFGSGNGIITGSDNVHIGYSTNSGASDVTNEIVIGASTTGNGSNTATYGNSNITDNYFNGNITLSDTGNPSLIVQDTAGGSSFLQLLSGNTGASNIYLGDTDDNNAGAIVYDHSDNSMSFRTNGFLEKMIIDSSGRVGINNSTPNSFFSNASQLVIGDGSTSRGMTIYGSSAGDSQIFFADGTTGDQQYRGALRYEHSSDAMVMFTSGSEKVRIDSSGNVGIGTSSVVGGSKLHISSANGTAYTSNAQLRISGANTNNNRAQILFSDDALSDGKLSYYPAAGTGAYFSLSARNTESDFILNASGNVGIGTSSPFSDAKLQVESDSDSQVYNYFRNTSTGSSAVSFIDVLSSGADLRIGAYGSGHSTLANQATIFNHRLTGSLLFGTEGSEKMRITSGGDVLIGTQTSRGHLTISGDNDLAQANVGIQSQSASSSTHYMISFFKSDGNTVGYISHNDTSTTYNTSSDYRLKENVVPMEGALDRVDALKPSRFNFIADPEKTVDGFIAHEVQAIIPEAVTGEKDAVDEEGNPVYQGIDQSKIVPLLVGAIQELRAEIESLKSQING